MKTEIRMGWGFLSNVVHNCAKTHYWASWRPYWNATWRNLVYLSLRACEHTGYICQRYYSITGKQNINQVRVHIDYQHPNGWCLLSSTQWTRVWCFRVFWQVGKQEESFHDMCYISGQWLDIGQIGERIGQQQPNDWCQFVGTLWTHESSQVVWCFWVLGLVNIVFSTMVASIHCAERDIIWSVSDCIYCISGVAFFRRCLPILVNNEITLYLKCLFCD